MKAIVNMQQEAIIDLSRPLINLNDALVHLVISRRIYYCNLHEWDYLSFQQATDHL